MTPHRKILLHFDTDPLPSVFDRIVALDSGADEVLSYGGVRREQVRDLVHGAIFTRGSKDLKHTAIFIGGRNVALGEELLAEVKNHLLPQFGLTVSALLDSNGANTTAAATARIAAEQVELKSCRVTLLGGSGPVGQRIAMLLARQKARIRITSLTMETAKQACEAVARWMPEAGLEPLSPRNAEELLSVLEGQEVVIGAGAAGVQLLPLAVRRRLNGIRLLIDLNAVPPAGIEGVEVGDSGIERHGVRAFGAIAMGQRKMKIHQAAMRQLFERNDQVLDIEEVYGLAGS